MVDRNTEDPRVRVTVRVSEQARDAFEELAPEMGRKASQLHRQAFAEFLARNGKPVDV